MPRKLTPYERDMMEAINSGRPRYLIARDRGVSRSAVTRAAHKIEAKGHAVRAAKLEAPAVDRAAPLVAAGLRQCDMARALGVTPARAFQLEQKVKARGFA